ncbi:MAG: FkbM family methyltransferase [Pseudomonadota bacterium]
MTANQAKPSRAGIGRSLDIYYRDTARFQRMHDLHRSLVRSGDLVFDIGAHVGDRTASFLRLGARVVALEPQPRVFRALRLLHGRGKNATLVGSAIGREAGSMTLFLNTRNPTVSTLSQDFMDAASDADGWREQVWDDTVTVPVTTLDALIAQHGVPNFVKLDVEGHEAAALEGLSKPIPALSFEFTTLQRAAANACLDRICALADYEYNLSLGEDHMLRHTVWISAGALRDELRALPNAANSGDVYARRL